MIAPAINIAPKSLSLRVKAESYTRIPEKQDRISGEMRTENEIPEPVAMGGIVSHFYYHLLGRIVPGTYLLFGAYWLLKGQAPDLNSITVTAVLITAMTAYVVSFLIGPWSHLFFDWLLRLLRLLRFKPKDLTNEMASALDKNHIQRPDVYKLGFNKAFLAASERCYYTLWVRAPQLAIMCSRWDAEAFTARQIGTVSLILCATTKVLIRVGKGPDHAPILFGAFLLITFLSGVQFRYSRRKAILAPFRMLASLTQETARSAAAAAQAA